VTHIRRPSSARRLPGVRRLAATATAAVVAALGALVAAPAGPAFAGLSTYAGICVPILEHGVIVDWRCQPFPHSDNHGDPECYCWNWGIDFHEVLTIPADHQTRYLDEFLQGMGLLDQAAGAIAAGDPAAAARLREQASGAFAAAGATLGSVPVRPGGTGLADLDRNRILPWTDPGLPAAAGYLTDGLNSMRQAATAPDPRPLRRAAMADLQRGYDQLSHLRPAR
jgi:hypothetical protein